MALQLFYGSHLDVISRRLAGAVAGDVAMVVELAARATRDGGARLDLPRGRLAARPRAGLRAGRDARPDRQRGPPRCRCCRSRRTWTTRCANACALPFDTDWQSDPRSVIIRVQLPDGVLHVEAPRKRLFSGTLYLFVIWLVGSSLLLFLRRQRCS